MRTSHRIIVAITLALALQVAAEAQLPRIRLNSVFPHGGQAGTKFPVSISGELSEGASELIFSHPDIEAIQQFEAETDSRVAHRKDRQFDVVIGDRVPPGRYDVRALGPAGLSAPRTFIVSHLPNKQFTAGGNSKEKPFAVEVGSVVNAQARANEKDYYRFTAQKFRPLLIQVLAERIDSKLDALLAVYDSDGKRVDKVRQSLTRDPILTFAPPADGEYLIEVADSTYQGSGEHFYQLEVSEQPLVEAIFPVVWQPNQAGEFTVYGYNLPEGLPVSGMQSAGNLQSAKIKLTPGAAGIQSVSDTGPSTNDAPRQLGWQANVAMVRGAGQFIALPESYSASPPVFLSHSDHPVIKETEADTSASEAQAVALPAEIAGQFFPRRDRDYFEFTAKKNQTLWIELSAQQFGTYSDPTIRILRKTDDGKTQSVATSDDIQALPNTRDSRRLYSGTKDVAFAFKPPSDGQFVVAVSDQYNVSLDDPRLTYRLSIQKATSDFRLIAFADPERHGDEKIAKPNGLGILPGGSTTLRVRLLNRHGFNKPVKITVEGLPAGVTAAPILLDANRKEGIVVLQAAESAKPQLSQLQVRGQTLDGKLQHFASVAAITQGANNTDALATQSRLCLDLPLAILDCKPAPFRIQAASQFSTARGLVKQPIPVTLIRRDDFKDREIALAAVQAPSGLKVESSKSKTDEITISLTSTDGKLKPGTHTFILGAKIKDKRPRNPYKATEAEGDLQKITQGIEATSKDLKKQQASLQSQAELLAAAQQAMTAVQSRLKEPRSQLSANLNAQLAAAESLAEQTRLAIGQIDSLDATASTSIAQLNEKQTGIQAKIQSATEKLTALRKDNAKLREQFGAITQELATAQSKAQAITTADKQAREALAALQAKQADLQKKKAETEKKLQEVRKNEIEKEAEFWVYSNAITLDIANAPVTVRADKSKQIAQDGLVDIGVFVERNFGYDGQVTIELVTPPDSGLFATPLVVGPGIDSGEFTILADKAAKLKTWPTLPAKIKLGGFETVEQLPIQLEVTKAKQK